MRSIGMWQGAAGWLRVALATAAVALTLLLPVANPGSGTAVNLHDVDVASLVRADHHAKPVPPVAGMVAVAVFVVALAERLRRQLTAPVALTALLTVSRRERPVPTRDTGVLLRATSARRGPPAVI
jgi:hypothetical protein